MAELLKYIEDHPESRSKSQAERLADLVEEQMRKTGLIFHTVWAKIVEQEKISKKNEEILRKQVADLFNKRLNDPRYKMDIKGMKGIIRDIGRQNTQKLENPYANMSDEEMKDRKNHWWNY